MNIFRVAVCDDETMDLKQITETVDCILNSENIDNTIMCYESGDKLMEAVLDGVKFDMMILDVLLPDKNGIELASCIRDCSNNMPIVFISNDKEMALCGYEVNAVRYLAKPLVQKNCVKLLYIVMSSRKRIKLLYP